KARRRPSGAICTPVQLAGVALSGVVVPSRVSQSSGAADAFSPPGRYTSVPVGDTSTCALPLLVLLSTPGTTGTAGPVTASVARSNGAAKSVASWTQVRWPLGRYRPKKPPRCTICGVPVGSGCTASQAFAKTPVVTLTV